MAIKTEREYRTIQLPDIQFRAVEEDEQSYIVEGYATTFNDPYVMFEFDGVKYKEEIDRDALLDADMSDVIFLYNHEGMVYARQANGTLQLSPNDKGLYIRADLSSTEASRQMFESIKAGLVTQMSWAFTIAEEEYDEKKHLRSIRKVNKVYDVSAVSIPANPNTDISARSYWDGVIEEERRSERERAEKVERIKNKLKGDVHE
jgi:HK97 family phage prohead protease